MKTSIKRAISFGVLLFANNLMHAESITPNMVGMICNVTSSGACQCSVAFLNHAENQNDVTLIKTKTSIDSCPYFLPRNPQGFMANCRLTKTSCSCNIQTVDKTGKNMAKLQSCPASSAPPATATQATGNSDDQSNWSSSLWHYANGGRIIEGN